MKFRESDVPMIVSLIEVGYTMEQIAEFWDITLEQLAKGIKKLFDGKTFVDLHRRYYIQGTSIPARKQVIDMAKSGDVKCAIFVAKTTGMIEKTDKTEDKPQTQTIVQFVDVK